jgi:phosphatidylglycerol---prolipoprotein diacylglyceryl transferase
MYPELFQIPFTHLTIKSYGLMMVIGFLVAVYIIKRFSRDITSDSQLVTNVSLYALIAGIIGARIFYVIHYFSHFQTDLLSVFAIWRGGLELLGGAILAIAVIFIYLLYHKLPVRRCLDILAIGLMLALAFGRVGCFLNGCCFGKPSNLPWAIRFPYRSFSYESQVSPDLNRNRPEPYLKIPNDFFGDYQENGTWFQGLKPYESLTAQQKQQLRNGQYRALPVHPAQLYSSLSALLGALLLYLFWRRTRSALNSPKTSKLFARPGCTFALMFILYGIGRFLLEFLRDDNPLEFDDLTVSQNISIILVVFAVGLMIVFQKMKPSKK